MNGELLALFSAFAFALASVCIAKGARTASGESGVLLCALVTALLSGLAWLLAAKAFPLAGRTIVWPAIGWFAISGLLATVMGRVALYKSIELAGVVRAATARRLMPFLSLLLGYLLIGETISGAAGCGMALIAASFILLYLDNRESLRAGTHDPHSRALVSRGLVFGVASALLYATSYVARKFGLAVIPDPFFGAFIGAITAIAFYAAGAAISGHYRTIARQALSTPNPWQLLAAILISSGQIAQFGALLHIGVGRVAFISSVEVYLSAFLALAVFKTEKPPGYLVILAMIVATAGVIVMAASR